MSDEGLSEMDANVINAKHTQRAEALPSGSALRPGRRYVFVGEFAADHDHRNDVPGQVDGRLIADDLVVGVVFILGDRDTDLDNPMVVGDVSGDLGLR